MCNEMYGHGKCSPSGMRRAAALCLALFASAAYADKQSIDKYFQALDLNGDGHVSLSEAAGDPVVVSRFDRADRNRDGKLSAKEFGNLSKVKVRVAKAKKDKDKEPSAAVGGTTREERRRTRAKKTDTAEAGD